MKSLNAPGELIELVEDFTGLAISEALTGAELDAVAIALSKWVEGPTFLNDCRICGLSVERIQSLVFEVLMCARNNEPVLL